VWFMASVVDAETPSNRGAMRCAAPNVGTSSSEKPLQTMGKLKSRNLRIDVRFENKHN